MAIDVAENHGSTRFGAIASKVRGERALATTALAINDRYNRHRRVFLGDIKPTLLQLTAARPALRELQHIEESPTARRNRWNAQHLTGEVAEPTLPRHLRRQTPDFAAQVTCNFDELHRGPLHALFPRRAYFRHGICVPPREGTGPVISAGTFCALIGHF